MVELIKMPVGKWTQVGLKTHVLAGGPDPRSPTRRGNFEGAKRPAQDMFGHVQRSLYSKQLSRGSISMIWMPTDVHIGATWKIRLNRSRVTAMWPYVKLLWRLVHATQQLSYSRLATDLQKVTYLHVTNSS